MNIRTKDGIKIYCLPAGARCSCTGKSPEVMMECPIGACNMFGTICIPELCDRYTEDITVE